MILRQVLMGLTLGLVACGASSTGGSTGASAQGGASSQGVGAQGAASQGASSHGAVANSDGGTANGSGGASQSGGQHSAGGQGASGENQGSAGSSGGEGDAEPTDGGSACACPEDALRWGMTGFFGVPYASLLDCAAFAYQSEAETEPNCTTTVACDHLAALQEALAQTVVQEALARGPITYGRPDPFPDEGYYRIDVGRDQILINSPCLPDQPECQDPPAEVTALRGVLEAITWRQLVQPSCVQALGTDCDESLRWASHLLSRAADAADRSCQTADDCVTTYLGTGCEQRCGTVVSLTGEQQLGEAAQSIDASYCNDYEATCGPVIVPPCIPPQPVSCVENVCTEGGDEPTF